MIPNPRIFGSIALASSILLASATVPSVAGSTTTVNIVASNWKFTPSTVEMHVGQTTTLHLTSSEGVHGLKSDDLGIPQTMITPGATQTVNVTPNKAGKFVLHCAIVCGAGHANMALTVNVLP